MPSIYKQKIKGKSYWRVRVRPPIRKAKAGYLPERKGVRLLVQRIDGVSRVQAVLSRTDKYTKKQAIARAKRHRKKIRKYEPELL